ncbi:TonB-dependent receptor domain-containing protein [Nitrincola sp. MINF-07-Sa-05]|uniref:TonB-dependent receptor domain-containing protein n=1 Tax=Nitrincola salilacus TaxID=3400273 RepID=UPI0039180C72
MNKSVFNAKHLPMLCLSVLPLSAVAHDHDAPLDADLRFNPIVVTATLAPRTADDSLASVTVIDQEQIRLQQPRDLIDLVKGQPGVDFSSNGGFGKTTSVYTRGAGGDSTLLLVDGIRLQTATTGGASWQFLTPGLFERFEIVRGPRGSLYGADASGGVIQGFLPDGQGEPRVDLTLGGGSFNSKQAMAGFSGHQDNTRFNFIANHYRTDGIEIREGQGRKGYDNTTGLVRLGHTFDNGADVSGLIMSGRGNTEFVGGNSDYRIQVAGLNTTLPLNDHWVSRLQLSESRDDNTSYETSRYNFDTKSHRLRWENTVWAGHHELIGGIELVQDKVDTSSYGSISRDNHALFGQGLFHFNPINLQLSLRYDDNEVYGDKTTGALALGYELDQQHTLRASYGTAFRAPSFNDLYWPGSGNLDLNPETSDTIELGARGQYQALFWDLAIYEANYKNLINWAPTPSGLFSPQNIDRARIRGIELAAGTQIQNWTLRAALTGTDPIDRADNTRLQRRTSKSARLDADTRMGDWTFGATVIAQGSRYNARRNNDKMPGYGLLNLRAGWEFARNWSAVVTLDNVLDKEYVTTRGFGGWDYKNPGRSGFLTLRYTGF